MYKLYIIATPIGNLKDITIRAIETLEKVNIIYCENTNNCKKLLSHYKINKKLKNINERNQKNKINELLKDLSTNEVAYITDAGTPSISDPGAFIVKSVKEYGADVVPIPGPSSIITAYSVSGIQNNKFCFLGFVPNKTKRKKFIKNAIDISKNQPVIILESTHRIKKFAQELCDISPDTNIIIAKELTKTHEKILDIKACEFKKYLEKDKDFIKGEFVVILYN